MRQDIRLLARVAMKAQEIYWTEYNIDITSCLTLSSLAMKIFRSRYYNDKEFPIHIPNRNEDEFFRSGYYGRHADMYKAYGKNLYYYDVNSLYPFIMKTYPMPCVLNTILRRMAHYNPFDNLQSPGDDSNTVDRGNNSSSNASSKKKRGLARGLKPLPNGKKKKIDVNSWGQLNQANSEMNTYTSDIGFQVRMYLPIIYESFKDVHNNRIALVVKGLEECYDISHVVWFDLKEKIKDAWRRYKYRLNTTLIIGNNPGDVKASPAPEFVPREDWVKFVDYYNSEKFLAKSKKNKENRAKLIASCTLGRTSMPITRHKLAEERGVTNEEIGRVEVYIPTHTKKDKTIQCPDVITELQNTMRKDPKSIRTGPNDAIAQIFGKERKDGTRGMGAGMSISLVEKIDHIVNENEELRSNNNELKFATEKLRKDLDPLTKYVRNIPVISPMDNFPSQQATSSSQREQEKHQHIDKECMLVGCPWRIVVHGVIVGVDSTDMCHSVSLGDDFYKVAIHDIVDGAIVSKDFYPRYFGRYKDDQDVRSASDMVLRSEGLLHVYKLKCRVVGAYFEKTGSKTFTVYSIAVTNTKNKTWFVKRRYINFERLYRHLKDIPNYTLHLPPKRFLSSSINDSFVHQRCIQLDRYLHWTPPNVSVPLLNLVDKIFKLNRRGSSTTNGWSIGNSTKTARSLMPPVRESPEAKLDMEITKHPPFF
ncbi:hypothetical protein GIB67_015789 [Kingdonia uniflora]|uniref:DNA-directed DNA polymerase n=1 Tax=Kingdonia uniflora TaxID=39325 RepID=A0A7J7NUG2_9MAGN|nr:hypothetical protein GIB67_015789 [Kingdonia uniflora]